MRSLNNFSYCTSVHWIHPKKLYLPTSQVKNRIYFPVITSKASSPFMVSKASSKAARGSRKGELATISYKFPFMLCLDKVKYHWLKNDVPSIILIDDIPDWPAINAWQCLTMLIEVWNVMITPLPLWSESDSWGLYGCIFYCSVWISTPGNI